MDPDKFSEFILENQTRIRAYIARMIGDADEAADLTQETFARAQAGMEKFRGESKFTIWLYSIATNVCLDYLKSAGRRRLQVTPPEMLAEIAKCDEEAPRFSATLLLDQAEMGKCMRRFIDELPSNQRMALLFHDIEGMTNPEVAEAMNCTMATAKIWIHRARKRLRNTLEENCSFSRDKRGVFVCEPKHPAENPPS